ncbi:hypothetical protein E3N88_44727 [Mikania micrantha]|uniref:Uncharacterized protein n=1 Tax=Mikania micrantha TaxID=192012 RepID=A0A5N6LDI8_9ASTR|nr:hypothetical protein E3N88_44727 [Mikania micrantha]
MFEFSTEVEKEMIFKRHRPRSRRKCDIEVPAAVGQDLSTVVRKTVYDMMMLPKVHFLVSSFNDLQDGLETPLGALD